MTGVKDDWGLAMTGLAITVLIYGGAHYFTMSTSARNIFYNFYIGLSASGGRGADGSGSVIVSPY